MAATALVLAFVHPWRQVREFKYLLYGSALGFAVFVALHNLLGLGAGTTAGIQPLQGLLEGLGVAAFLGAIFVCPPAFVIGLGGVLIMAWRGRKVASQRRPPDAT